MRWVLTHPSGVKSALARSHALKNCLSVIGETSDVDRATRLSIYGNGYFWRIIDAVGATFSSVRNIIGADAFYDVARAYLVKHPSTFKSIDDIGAHMSEFLKSHALSRRFPFLSDLTAIEWAAHQSFYANDATRLDPDQLKRIAFKDWPKATIHLDPSVRLFQSSWPVNDLWKDDGKWRKQRLAQIKKSRRYFLVYRHPSDKFVRIPLINPIQHRLLSVFVRGKTLGQALANLPSTTQTKREIDLIQSWFQQWAENGIIHRISLR
jgi:hypothetical protein